MLISAFYSDSHFGHTNIIKHCNRPFRDADHMGRELIRRYNKIVGPQDTVLWCGDSFYKGKSSHFRAILAELNGDKILVRGNHDKSAAVMADLGFSLVMTECTMHIGNRTCRVSHFPYSDIKHSRGGTDENRSQAFKDKYEPLRPKRVKGEVLIHGHTHSNKKRTGNCIHVGVDAWDYAPVTMAQVEELVAKV